MAWLVGTSLLLQLAAAALALRLIRVTGRRSPWLLVAAACVLMTVRRAVTLSHLLTDASPVRVDPTAEWIALVISILMLSGVTLIGGVFRELRAEQERRLREVDERARAEKHMLEAQRLESLGLLAGGIAHDFNNLLTVILGNAALAQAQSVRRSDSVQYLAEIERAARRAADLAKRLLAYAGRGRVEIVERDLNDLVRETEPLFKASVPGTVRVALELAHDPLPIRGDVVQLTQVLMNLVINAGEAIGTRAGTIVVRTAMLDVDRAWLASAVMPTECTLGRHALLQVTDTGVGMTPDAVQRIFEPFVSSKGPGRGLGLAAVLGIVRGHGGALRVISTSEHGTSFDIVLPLSHAQRVNVGAAARGPQSAVDSATVLVIDDDAPVLTLTQRMLERAGFQVVASSSGIQALRIISERRADLALVLLDRTMPDIAGEEVLRRIAAEHPDLPVVMMSGFGEQDTIERLAGCELAGFLAKPFGFDELVGAVNRALQHAISRRGV